MWLIFSISSLIAFISCMSFAVLSYINNPKSELNLRFSIVSFFIGGWAFFPFITSVISNNEYSLFYGRVCYLFAIFTPPAFFHFVFATLGIDKKKINKYLIYVFYFISLFFLMFSFSDLFIKGIVTHDPNSHVVPGPLYIFYVLFFSALCTYAIILLFKRYGTLDGYKREQMKFLALAFFIALISGGIHLISTYVNIEVIPHDLLIFFWSLIVFYSISKYGYLNIKLALLKSIIFVFVYCFILGIPFYIGFKTNRWFLASIILFILSTVGPVLLRYLQGKTEKLLMAEQEKYQQFLLQASKGMVEQKEISKLTQLIVRMITKSVKVKFAALFIYDEERQFYYCVAGRGQDIRNKNITFNNKSNIIKFIKSCMKPFFLFNASNDIKDSFLDVSKNSTLVVPAVIRKDLVAFLVLGDKLNGTLYSNRDLEVFKTLSNQAALAIANCNFLNKTNNQQKRLFEAEKLASIGGMADGLAHQIKNRLNSFSLIGGELDFEINNFKEQYKDFVEREEDVKRMIDYIKEMSDSIMSNVKKTNVILKGILSFAKSDEQDKFFSSFSFREVVEQSIDLIKIKHHKSNISFSCNIPDRDNIYGVRVQIQEAIFNCIDNAYEAILEKIDCVKNPLLHEMKIPNVNIDGYQPQIDINLKYIDKNAVISIKDNGIGIKEENKSKVFSAFFTTKASSKSGSGIGSYVVKRMIVENHKGNIEFKSKYGYGTTFIITLPMGRNV